MDEEQGALTQLRAYLAQRDLAPSTRLPPEREMCDILGVTRNELRKALAILEHKGELWRHVGKGTFTGTRPVEELFDIGDIAHASNPREVMQARLLVEPLLAREAALNATASEIAEMRLCLTQSREAVSWRHYESCDNRLHRLIAAAAHNSILLALFDTLNAVRRTVVWGRLRNDSGRPPADHHSFAEHDRLVQAMAERDAAAADEAMHVHLRSVERKLMSFRQAAE